ncbi:nucleotide pyrophosphohydrolase, partial [Bacillus tropicus]
LQDIAEMNIVKLAKRYLGGFSREASQKRVDVK